jgi:hypothetical protein
VHLTDYLYHFQVIRYGVSDALNKLLASQFLYHGGRQILVNRREVIALAAQTDSELLAVRSALLSVYLALPVGALSMETDNEGHNVVESITEPAGWNDVLDQVWRAAVEKAKTPQELMECVLLLEFYLNKAWFNSPQNKVLSALPNAHFAIRCVSFASVALRVYCIDKAVDYEHILAATKDTRRGVTGSGRLLTAAQGHDNYQGIIFIICILSSALFVFYF